MPDKRKKRMSPKHLMQFAVDALEDLKAEDIRCIDVRHLTSLMDYMIIASGRSDRHTRAVSEALLERCKENSVPILGHEGESTGEWILVDLADVVVHVMLPRTRDFYELEKLWEISKPSAKADADHDHLGVR